MTPRKASCAGCRGVVAKDGAYMKCTQCKQIFDLFCANFSPEKFATFSVEFKRSWICVECCSRLHKGENSQTPVRTHQILDQSMSSPTENVNMLRGGTLFTQGPKQNPTSNYVLNEMKETVILELRKMQANFEEQLIEEIYRLLAEQFLGLKNEFLEKINMMTSKIEQLEVTLMTKADTYKDAITKNLPLNPTTIKVVTKTKTQSQTKAKPVVQIEKPSNSLAASVPDADRTIQKSRTTSTPAASNPNTDNLDKGGWVEVRRRRS
ncbi:unnamed protein product [Parnassius mnemosyne]|uniref:Uncharacterized protein n=1 Tax=Parnassius mnemosyne TaxID=213953 RepID=A0AAV1KHX9_9NEOP